MPLENFSIRLGRADDILDIYTMVCELENCVFDRVVFRSIFQKHLASDTCIYLIAFHESIAIGFLSAHGQYLLHHGGLVFEIQEMYVDPHYRSRGIGKCLMDELKRQLKHRNYTSLEVTSHVKREQTHQFYLKQGFLHSHFKFTQTAP